MANMLGPSSPPAHILVGVRGDGTIVGVPPASHLDDADLHQKVQRILNRTPNFSYEAMTIGSVSVGVYEIRPGGRPFFPLRDAPPLLRHTALYRNGSSTDVASPTMILEWGREDDADIQTLRVLERRKLEADARMHISLQPDGIATTNDSVEFRLRLENVGRAGFSFSTCSWHAIWNEKFHVELRDAGTQLPIGYQSPLGENTIGRIGLLMAGQIFRFSIRICRADILQHFHDANILLTKFSPDWAVYEFGVDCCSEFGDRERAVVIVRM